MVERAHRVDKGKTVVCCLLIIVVVVLVVVVVITVVCWKEHTELTKAKVVCCVLGWYIVYCLSCAFVCLFVCLSVY